MKMPTIIITGGRLMQDRRDYLMDKIDELEDMLYDLKQAGEYSAALAVQQDLADLYHRPERAA